jgi:hypothetical protein
MPDLNSQHEMVSGHGRDGVQSGIVGVEGGEAGTDDDFLEGVDDFVVESCE